MPDIIQLLPDSVANQIAAGEVIQRPASAVKELMENAVDAGATDIRLIIKDAGKTLIQVVDNGSGMSETDARMSLERHATSKITAANDLFSLTTMGFRGEALASMAAIAQMDIRTRRADDELGTLMRVEGSTIVSQEPCQAPTGTSISVKNLFFNVPARRKFLKSDPVETRHIIDEFQRVALPNPHLSLSLHHNGNALFELQEGTFRQRIVGIFGKKQNQKLVPVEEETNIVIISGFVGKPEFAKKTRGEQFFFVNSRFIKSTYLHHAVQLAFEELIPKGFHPSYFLNLAIDPELIDINIHPTKTEIKFEDERAIYAIIRSAVRRSLGQYNIAPSLDFERETSFDHIPPPSKGQPVAPPVIEVDPTYNPFEAPSNGGASRAPAPPRKDPLTQSNLQHWEKLFDEDDQTMPEVRSLPDVEPAPLPLAQPEANTPQVALQMGRSYILAADGAGMLVIHQQRAHERILYEHFKESLGRETSASQQLLFPKTLEFTAADSNLVGELHDEIAALGFDLRSFGKNSFIVQGVPADLAGHEPKTLIEGLLEHYKAHLDTAQLDKRENLARSLARQAAIRQGQALQPEEMQALVNQLFSCEMPHSGPSGGQTMTRITIQELEKRFE